MSAPLDPFALGGYQREHDQPGVGPDPRLCPLLDLWREYKAVDADLDELEESGDEEDRLVNRLRAIEDEIAGSIATNPTDVMVQLTLLVSYWRDSGLEWGDFAGGLVGKMYLGLYTIEGGT